MGSISRQRKLVLTSSRLSLQFALITWIGPQVKVMRKAKLSVQSADVKKVLAAYSIDVAASSQDDLAEVSLSPFENPGRDDFVAGLTLKVDMLNRKRSSSGYAKRAAPATTAHKRDRELARSLSRRSCRTKTYTRPRGIPVVLLFTYCRFRLENLAPFQG